MRNWDKLKASVIDKETSIGCVTTTGTSSDVVTKLNYQYSTYTYSNDYDTDQYNSRYEIDQ